MHTLNLLAPGIFGGNSKSVTSGHILRVKFMSISSETAIGYMPKNTFGYKSTLIQVMARCCQVTNQILTQIHVTTMALLDPRWVNVQKNYE